MNQSEKRCVTTAGGILIGFLLLYCINYVIPLQRYDSYFGRINNTIEMICFITALCIIVRERVWSKRAALFSAFPGIICFIASRVEYNLFTAKNEVYILPVVTYAGMILFETYMKDNKTTIIKGKQMLLEFGIGAVLGIPLAVVNTLYFVTTGDIHMQNPILQALLALRPAIHENVMYLLIIYAICISRLKESKPTKLCSVMVFLAIEIPFSLMHQVENFRTDFWGSLLMVLILTLVFGLPEYILLKKRTLQSTFGMHWVIDFIRFMFGF